MAYTNQMILNCTKDASIVATAGTSIYKMVVPSGVSFRVQKMITRVSTAAGNTTSGAVKILKTPSGGSATLLKTGTGVGVSAAIGVTKCDTVSEISGLTNYFKAGDTLDIQVATTATSTGKVDVDLVIALDTP